MIDIFNSDAFTMTSLAAAIKKIVYKPSRLGPGGLNLFDEKPIATTSIIIESRDGQLSLIPDSPRGAPGDMVGDVKTVARSFVARHLRRNAKVMADEVQGVRLFGTEDQTLTVEAKVAEKLAIIQAMHEVTWEYQRVGALIGSVVDSDGSTVLLDVNASFGVTQSAVDYAFGTTTTDVRSVSESVADLIDAALGGNTFESIHAFCGANFYDALIKHKYVQDLLKAQMAFGRMGLDDLRGGFTVGGITFERCKRWKVKDQNGTSRDMINTDIAYAFPIGANTSEGPMFVGRFAPQPFLSTVNRLNPPLVVKATPDKDDQFMDLIGISCPLYLNTRPDAVIKLTKS